MGVRSTVKVGDELSAGHVIGTVQETETIEHRVMVPPGKEGVVKTIESGSFNITQTVCKLEDGSEIAMMQEWPVRHPRPFVQKYAPDVPLMTGQRILDFLFPSPKEVQQESQGLSDLERPLHNSNSQSGPTLK